MSDSISSFFQLLEGRLGLHPDIVAAAALVIVLALAFLSLYLSSKLRSTREIIEQLGKRLGYEPPYGDGTEIFHQEFRKEIVERGKDVKIKHLEQRVADLEAEANNKDTRLAAHEQRSTELEGQLQQASRRIEEAAAQAVEQAQTHRIAVEKFEQRLRDLEVASESKLAAHQQHSTELEEQLQQASERNEKILTQAAEQERAHRTTVLQFEQRTRELEAESVAGLAELQQRANELEEQLRQASLRMEEMTAQATGQARTHQITVEHLEQRLRYVEAQSDADLAALQQHSKTLEEQLRQASLKIEEVTAQSGEQAHAHRMAAEQSEQRVSDVEAASSASRTALQQRANELDEQLRQASLRNEEVAAQAGEQAHAHQIAVEQFEQRIHDLEATRNASLTALQQRSHELEEQLHQAQLRNEETTTLADQLAHSHRAAVEQFEQRIRHLEADNGSNLAVLQQHANELEEQLLQAIRRNEEITARAGEQADAHRTVVEQFEQRVRDMEAESKTSLSALQQHSKELEEQLQQVTIQYEIDRSTAQREALEQIAEMEQFELRTREFRTEREGWESGLKTLHARVQELEGQLQQAAGQMAEAVSASQTAPPLIAEHRDDAAETSGQLLRRAEWITACAVGAIRLVGLVAAEAYAAAAIAADRNNLDARWLIFELAKLRRATQKPLPSVVEALTTFDERAAELFGADLPSAVDIVEREAFERYRAGLNRSALLAVNLNLALREQTAAKFSPRTQIVQEMKAVLLGRIGGNGKPSNASPGYAAAP